jgi:hypothetical protein
MKKVVFVSLLVLVAMGAFTGVAAAQSSQPQSGMLHEYMEMALADKLNIPLNTVAAEIDAGKTMAQIALDHGIAVTDLRAFLNEVRAQALQAAVADGIITQTQADSMLQRGRRGADMGTGTRQGGMGSCDGSGIPVGTGMHRGGRWQQNTP